MEDGWISERAADFTGGVMMLLFIVLFVLVLAFSISYAGGIDAPSWEQVSRVWAGAVIYLFGAVPAYRSFYPRGMLSTNRQVVMMNILMIAGLAIALTAYGGVKF